MHFFFSFIHNQWKHKETPKQEELSLTNEKCTFFSQHYMWFWRGGKKGFISKWQPDIKITKDSQTLCNTWSAPAYNINLCACPSSGISFPTQESKQSYSLTKSLQHNALDKYKKKKRESLPPYKTNKTPRDNRMFQCNLCISPYDKENTADLHKKLAAVSNFKQTDDKNHYKTSLQIQTCLPTLEKVLLIL